MTSSITFTSSEGHRRNEGRGKHPAQKVLYGLMRGVTTRFPAPLIGTLGSVLIELQQEDERLAVGARATVCLLECAWHGQHPQSNNSVLCLSHLIANSPFNL